MPKKKRSQDAIPFLAEPSPRGKVMVADPRAELEALLDEAPASTGKKVVLYDFRNPHRISGERLRTLEAMYDRIARSLEGWMMGRLRSQIEITLEGVQQVGFSAFSQTLPTPCCAYLFDIRDSGGQQVVMNVGTTLGAVLVDRFFGGFGDPIVPGRGLTPIERLAVKVVMERIAKLLIEAWVDYVELDLTFAAFESAPEIIRATDATDSVLATTYAVKVLGVESQIQIALPFSVIDRFLQQAVTKRVESTAGTQEERLRNRQQAEILLRRVKVGVSARLPDFRISLGDLASLEAGMVLDTGIRSDAPLEVRVRDNVRYTASAARVGAKMAVSVEGPVGDGPMGLDSLFPTHA